jgi:hypothetical protein
MKLAVCKQSNRHRLQPGPTNCNIQKTGEGQRRQHAIALTKIEEIMRPPFDPSQFSRLLDDDPCGSVSIGKILCSGSTALAFRYARSRTAAFRGTKATSAALPYFGPWMVCFCSFGSWGGELQDFAVAHPSSGRQFQDELIAGLGLPASDLVDRRLLDSAPMNGLAGPVEASAQRDSTGIALGLRIVGSK